MTFEVRVGPKAHEDLRNIYDWIADQAGNHTADDYLVRIARLLGSLAEMPNRGTPRDDLAPGLRTASFERRATVAYMVSGDTVTIQRVLHAGRDLQGAFDG